MWKYIISFLFISQIAAAQVELKEPERQVFLRFGVDLSRFVLPYISDFNQSGFELNADTELKYKYFPTVEAGYSKLTNKTEVLNYQSEGSYFRVGLNYNMLNYKQRFDRNIFFIGARYGFTAYSQEITEAIIKNEWGTINTSVPTENLSAHWLEGVIGLRGEIFKNFYMGYTIRIKQIVSRAEYGDVHPYWIPGFGKGSKSTSIGMSYCVFYAIPIKNPKPDFEK
jgi:hypothetical protein